MLKWLQVSNKIYNAYPINPKSKPETEYYSRTGKKDRQDIPELFCQNSLQNTVGNCLMTCACSHAGCFAIGRSKQHFAQEALKNMCIFSLHCMHRY